MPSPITTVSLSPDALYEKVADAVWVVLAARTAKDFDRRGDISQGSAVAVAHDRLLTNCHVVKDRPTIVIIQDELIDAATVVGADGAADRCVLAPSKVTLKPVSGIRNFSAMRVGERVFTVGAPSGLERTLGEGLVSGLRTIEGAKYVQTSAPISPGSSGGGLFDTNGNLLGITTFLLRETQNLNFAVAAETYWR